MPHRDLLAIGTSAGGFEALRALAAGLPRELPASVLVTIHLPSGFRSGLDAILTRSGPLPAVFASDGARLEPGRIYIAPPERHLLVANDRLSLGLGPRENNTRPAIDPMFRSAALCCGARTVGVVLTGALGDGASGLAALNQCGGITVVQDPRDAAFPEMPATALRVARPHYVVPLAEMPALFSKLIRQVPGEAAPCPEGLGYEVEIARSGRASMTEMDRLGRRSVLACPDCGGVTWEIKEGDLLRYRCHIGHAYTAELMSVAIDDNLRRALGSSLRALDERIAVARKLEQQAADAGQTGLAGNWAAKVREFEHEAEVIRSSIRRIDRIAAQFAKGEQPPSAEPLAASRTN